MNQTIGVNITPQSFQPTLHFSQGDVGRVFIVNVTDYSIPSGATVTCVATKPSGMGFTVSGTVSGNTVTFTSTAEMTDEWGRFPAEIRIASGDTLLGTANFLMIGEKDPHPASTIDGTQEELIPQLTLLVNRIEAAAESVHDLTVSATTLAAGSDATATYDSTNNSIAFGIPRGADGDVTRSEFNDLKSDLPFTTLNLFNVNDLNANKMITPSTGTMDSVSGWSATNYINVSGMSKVMIMIGEYNHYSHYAFYDSSKTYISGGSARSVSPTYTYTDVEVPVPNNAVYIRVCVETSLASGYMLVDKAVYKETMEYAQYGKLTAINDKLVKGAIDSSKIASNSVILTVGSGKDYAKFEDALAVANSDTDHHYILQVYEGTYDVFADVTPDSSYIGYNVANLEIVGIGNKDNIVIYGYFSDSVSSSIRDKVSIFNIKGDFKCENITISAKNIRYTIHDDYSVVSHCTVEYVDCVLKGEAMTHNNVYGCGLWNGTTYKFTRCKFVGKTSTFCWGFHTIANATDAITPAHTIFNDCTFETDNTYFSTFNSNHTKYRDSVTFNGCRFCGFIYPTGTQNMIDIYGSGNSDLELRDGTTAKDCIIKFGDTTARLANKNGSTLSKGTVVKRSGWNGFDMCGNTDYPLGVLLEDTVSGGYGTIQTKGVLPNTLLECSAGQKISNNNGTLEISASNVIGVCVMTNLIKLIN